MSWRYCARASRSSVRSSRSSEGQLLHSNLIVVTTAKRSLLTNPSLAGNLSTSKFLTPRIGYDLEDVLVTGNGLAQSMSDLGFTYYYPVDLVARGLEFMHVSAGMPYWLTIVASGVTVRLALWYSLTRQLKFTSTWTERSNAEKEITYEMNLATAKHRHLEAEQLFHELKYHEIINKKKMLAVAPHFLVQVICFASVVRALHKCNSILPGFKTEGLFWSPNLAEADSTFLLPLITSSTVFTFLAVIGQVNMMMAGSVDAKSLLLDKKTLAKIAGLSLAAGGVSYSGILSSSVNIYMLSTMGMSLTQNLILKQPAVAQWLDMPQRRPGSELPYYARYSQMNSVSKAASAQDTSLWQRLKSFKGTMGVVSTSQMNARSWKEQKGNRHQLYLEKWKEAGTGPVPVTYAFNPLTKAENKSEM